MRRGRVDAVRCASGGRGRPRRTATRQLRSWELRPLPVGGLGRGQPTWRTRHAPGRELCSGGGGRRLRAGGLIAWRRVLPAMPQFERRHRRHPPAVCRLWRGREDRRGHPITLLCTAVAPASHVQRAALAGPPVRPHVVEQLLGSVHFTPQGEAPGGGWLTRPVAALSLRERPLVELRPRRLAASAGRRPRAPARLQTPQEVQRGRASGPGPVRGRAPRARLGDRPRRRGERVGPRSSQQTRAAAREHRDGKLCLARSRRTGPASFHLAVPPAPAITRGGGSTGNFRACVYLT